jgi:tRNA modification GTPase
LDLASASTIRTAEILLEQVEGALDRELTDLFQEIVDCPSSAIEHVDQLLERGGVGIRLLTGWSVVVMGRPNVGKSRLLNALAGYQRAIVDPTPGTTRDLISITTAFEGWPIAIFDTAGMRKTGDAIELLGIERAAQHRQTADLVLKVLNRSEPLQADDCELIASPGPAIIVANKGDLPRLWGAEEPALALRSFLTVSAERGDGLQKLIDEIVAHVIPRPPDSGAGVPFRPAHLEYLRRVRGALQENSPELARRCLERMSNHGFDSNAAL